MNEKLTNEMTEQLKKIVAKSRQFLEDEDLKQKADELKVKTEEIVRKYPVKSILVGLGIGFILGKILRSDD